MFVYMLKCYFFVVVAYRCCLIDDYRDNIVEMQRCLKLSEAEAAESAANLSLVKQRCSQLEKELESKTKFVIDILLVFCAIVCSST